MKPTRFIKRVGPLTISNFPLEGTLIAGTGEIYTPSNWEDGDPLKDIEEMMKEIKAPLIKDSGTHATTCKCPVCGEILLCNYLINGFETHTHLFCLEHGYFDHHIDWEKGEIVLGKE